MVVDFQTEKFNQRMKNMPKVDDALLQKILGGFLDNILSHPEYKQVVNTSINYFRSGMHHGGDEAFPLAASVVLAMAWVQKLQQEDERQRKEAKDGGSQCSDTARA